MSAYFLPNTVDFTTIYSSRSFQPIQTSLINYVYLLVACPVATPFLFPAPEVLAFLAAGCSSRPINMLNMGFGV
jgi:hypothetical protein